MSLRADVRGRVLLAVLCAGSTGIAAMLWMLDPDVYRFVFGDLNPIAVTFGASVIGLASVEFLLVSGWIRLRAGRGRDYVSVALLGMAMTSPVLLVDWLGGFPKELNVALPASLLFYPAIAVVAELLFHAVPLALISLVGRRRSEQTKRWIWWTALTVAASIEPVLQVLWGAGESPTWANAYVGLHLIAFNVLGLAIMLRRGFLAMYVFRVGYYAIWHVAWGEARLALLFGG